MRTKLVVGILMLCALASAETIRLKNGKKIVADSVREVGDKFEYSIGDSTFAIPKSSVETVEGSASLSGHRISCEASKAASLDTSKTKKIEEPHTTSRIPMKTEFLCRQLGFKTSSPGISPVLWMDRCARILAGGGLNEKALEEVESECNPELSAAAYYVAGNFDHMAKNEDGAAEYLRTAVEYSPDNAEVLQLYVDVLTNLARYPEAVPYAERAASRIGPDALVMLGRAYYLAGRKDQATQTWQLYMSSRGYSGSVDSYIQQAEAILRKNNPNQRRYDDDNYDYQYRYRPPVIK